MNKSLYAIRDNKVGQYGQPCIFRNHAEATRSFGDIVGDTANSNNLYAKHPADFSICYIGEFNAETGEISSCIPVQVLAVGSDFSTKEF